MINTMNQQMDLDWDSFDILAGSLPEEKDVFYIDINNQPNNWSNNLYGPWFPRRLVCVEVPALHASTRKYKVVIGIL